MSTHASGPRSRSVVKIKPMSATQRRKLAIQQLLGAVDGTDEAAAVIAALEIVNECLALGMSIQQRLQEKYEELTALAGGKRKPDLGPVPVPIHPVGITQFNPYGRFDPYQLLTEYGHDQLRAVLLRATQDDLKEAVGIVQSREPGTRPASRAKKAAMIDYIVAHTAGQGY